ncbi:KH domain-containing protein [bacterium]|nr:KH domain-containing protein [bacterium]NIN91507.1 KH domain-containing protein [bacterium]NIO17912.1 KH domain-containing protein [bacterium]NIO72893.1 KH domain-containing protein [bacterium]
MEEKEFSGKDVEEAIEKGLRELGLSRNDVEVKILDEGKAGLFGLMGASPAKIKLIVRPLKGLAAEEEREAVGEKPSGVNLVSAQKKVKEELDELLKLMGMEAEVTTSLEGGRVVADIKSENGAILIGKKGQTLNALQLIVNLIVNRDEKTRTRVIVDSESYRQRREKALVKMAREVADEVKNKGRPRELEPMNPAERRVIHLALKNDKEVETTSKGEGNFRRVVVSPKKK